MRRRPLNWPFPRGDHQSPYIYFGGEGDTYCPWLSELASAMVDRVDFRGLNQRNEYYARLLQSEYEDVDAES